MSKSYFRGRDGSKYKASADGKAGFVVEYLRNSGKFHERKQKEVLAKTLGENGIAANAVKAHYDALLGPDTIKAIDAALEKILNQFEAMEMSPKDLAHRATKITKFLYDEFEDAYDMAYPYKEALKVAQKS